MNEPGGGSTAVAGPTEQDIVITRIFDAPRERVFEAWTDPRRLAQWWGPKGFTTPVCRLDARPGGAYHYCMRAPEGHEYWGTGVYREVVEPERIVCTDSFADADGNPVAPTHYGMSASWPVEALVTVTLAAHEGGTRFTLRHAVGFAPDAERDMCRQGWAESLDRLEGYLGRAATADSQA